MIVQLFSWWSVERSAKWSDLSKCHRFIQYLKWVLNFPVPAPLVSFRPPLPVLVRIVRHLSHASCDWWTRKRPFTHFLCLHDSYMSFHQYIHSLLNSYASFHQLLSLLNSYASFPNLPCLLNSYASFHTFTVPDSYSFFYPLPVPAQLVRSLSPNSCACTTRTLHSATSCACSTRTLPFTHFLCLLDSYAS